MYNFKRLILFYCLINALDSFAQDLKIIGADDLKPVPNVLVHNKDHSISLITDELGEIPCFNLKKRDSLFFKHSAYHHHSLSGEELQKNGPIIILSEKVISLGAFVFYSNRFSNKAAEIPQMIQQIEAHDFELDQPMSNAEVLMKQGQVFVQKSQMGGGSPVLRGFEANKVLLMLDGIKMNNAIYRSGHVHNLIQIDPYSLNSTEIIFGPGSVSHGSDALGGVINLSTKKPLFSKDSSFYNLGVLSKYASVNNGKTLHTNLRYSSPKHAWIINFTRTENGDLKAGRNGHALYPNFGQYPFYAEQINGKDTTLINEEKHIQRNTGFNQTNFHIKYGLKLNEYIKIESAYLYATSSNIPRFDRLNDYKNNQMTYAKWEYGPYNYSMAYFKTTEEKERKLYDKSEVTLSYQRINEDRIIRKFNSKNELNRNEDVNVYTFNLDLQKKINKKHHLYYGFSTDYNHVSSVAYTLDIFSGIQSSISTRYPDGGSSQQDLSLYGFYEYNMSNRLKLNFGNRLSYRNILANFSSRSFYYFDFEQIELENLANSFSTSAIYEYNPATHYKLIFSNGYRIPNLDDISKIFDSQPGNVVLPNSELSPEYANNIELNFEKNIQDRLLINIGLYHTWVNDIITRKTATYNGQDSVLYDGVLSQVEMQKNSGQGIIKGFSIQISSELSEHFAYKSSLNLTKGYESENKTPLAHIPPLFGTTKLIWKHHYWSMEAVSIYNAWKYITAYGPGSTDRLEEATIDGSPSWLIFDINAKVKLDNFLQIQFGLQNIFDKHYKAFSSGISGPGRNFIFGIKGQF